MSDVSLASRAAGPIRFVGRVVDLYLGFVCVVIAPAVFWSIVLFSICAINGVAAVKGTLVFFTAAASFLTYISSALNLRI